jgi:hypothetical protein
MPAMLNGVGGVVRPDFVSIYYKRRPSSDPECQRMGIACVICRAAGASSSGMTW